jgi:DNA repair photolyase
MMHHKIPLHLGGMSDPFQNSKTAAYTRQVLKELDRINYPIVLSTKNTDQLIKDENLRVLKKLKHLVVQISFTTMDARYAKKIEPNSPNPQDRLNATKILNSEGFYLIARLQPLIIPWKSIIINTLIPALSEFGYKHIILEHLKLPVERNKARIDDFLKDIRWDAYKFYNEIGASLVGREWILPSLWRWNNLQGFIQAIHQANISCGVADYGLTHLGDTKCCCGIDNVAGFSNWFKGNLSNIISFSSQGRLSKNKLNEYWYPKSSIRRILNSNGRIDKAYNMSDYLHLKWNQPSTANSPDTFLGITWSGKKDKNGDCVYDKEKKK